MTEGTAMRHTRRDILRYSGAATLGVVALGGGRIEATPEEMQAAIRKLIGEAKINPGRVKLEIPPLVENGNTVPCSVTVDSPMTAKDYVRAIHIFNERNPQPNVISIKLGPRAGRANVATRIRLNDTQEVVAIAELSDGSFWSGTAEVIVTLGACAENII